MSDYSPSPTAFNGPERGAHGRFVAGNKCGQGNPMNRRVQRMRVAFVRAVTPADIAEIVSAIITKAKGGDVLAAREVFDRMFGRAPMEVDEPPALVREIDITRLTDEQLIQLREIQLSAGVLVARSNEK